MMKLSYNKENDFAGYTWMMDKEEKECIDFMNGMFKSVFPTLIELGIQESSISLKREDDGKLCVQFWNENHFGSELSLTKPLKPMLHEYCDSCGRDMMSEMVDDLQKILSEFQATLDTWDWDRELYSAPSLN